MANFCNTNAVVGSFIGCFQESPELSLFCDLKKKKTLAPGTTPALDLGLGPCQNILGAQVMALTRNLFRELSTTSGPLEPTATAAASWLRRPTRRERR